MTNALLNHNTDAYDELTPIIIDEIYVFYIGYLPHW